MRVICLVENTACKDIGCAHGLSIYIETQNHRILFDAGPDGQLLLSNAEKLGIDLKEVDIAILSHGHYDHAGGMRAFLEHNGAAKLYIHNLAATRGHLATAEAGWRDIGIDSRLCSDYADRIIFTGERCLIDDELLLFSDIISSDFVSGANSSLYEEFCGQYQPDKFEHEQSLIVKNGNSYALFAGCAHRGIVNIMRRAADICQQAAENVFSGFHLTNPGLKIDQPDEFVRLVAQELAKYPSRYYTGHCTGMKPFRVLRAQLGERVHYLSAGLDVTV